MAAAKQNGSRCFEPEELLIELLEVRGVAAQVLRNLCVDLLGLRARAQQARADRVLADRSADRAARLCACVVEAAMVAAREMKCNYIGTEHLLFGLMTLEDQPVGRLLTSLGIARASLMKESLRVLGGPRDDSRASSRRGVAFGIGRVLRRCRAAIEHIGRWMHARRLSPKSLR
jgi:ATP-dependent Clp protease ATP-binding subunit ClpA